jgi:hypothetical protein
VKSSGTGKVDEFDCFLAEIIDNLIFIERKNA